jgi:nucleoside-diphosphate-sugar epimerase
MADTRRVLITGGSGFIGTNAVGYFSDIAGYEVLNLDIRPPADEKHRVCWRQVDLLQGEALRTCISAFDPHDVIHLAARTDLNGADIEDYAANVAGVENLLDALQNAPSLQRVLFASSMLVCKVGHRPTSDLDFCPANAYGASKVAGEQLVRKQPPNCTWAIVRPTSIWGPWFGEPYRNFFDYVLKGRYFHIGKARVAKTYGYVGNAIYQLDALLRAPASEVAGRMFYLGDSSEYEIRDWADAIAMRCGIRIPELAMPLVRGAAAIGDLLKRIGISFPMTSFRLNNMTTENRIDLQPILSLAPDLPFERGQAIDLTLRWMKQHS